MTSIQKQAAEFESRLTGLPDEALVVCIAEEAGEFCGAYRRWAGYARRAGTPGDMSLELADVVIAAYTVAARLNIDLEAALEEKAAVIMARPARQEM